MDGTLILDKKMGSWKGDGDGDIWLDKDPRLDSALTSRGTMF